MPHKYCISRKNTNNADKINPIPKLKIIKQAIGYKRKINFHVKAIPSAATNAKKMINVNPKLMRDETFCEKRNRYFGTFTLVKILAFPTKEFIPRLVASTKYEKMSWPANK